jgi:hypothetical protein
MGRINHGLGLSLLTKNGLKQRPVVQITVPLDLACPFSKKAWNTFKQLTDMYTTDQLQVDKITYVQFW